MNTISSKGGNTSSSSGSKRRKKKDTKKQKDRSTPGTPSRHRRTSSLSSSLSSPKPSTPSVKKPDEPTEPSASNVKCESEELASALNTLQRHITYLQVLRTRNSELQQETTELKQQINAKDETIWEMKDYNEHLQDRVNDLETQCDNLRDALRKIRRLSSGMRGDLVDDEMDEA